MKPAENPRLKPEDVFCKTPKCRGVLFDETSNIQRRLGFVVLQCRQYRNDYEKACGGRWAIKTTNLEYIRRTVEE